MVTKREAQLALPRHAMPQSVAFFPPLGSASLKENQGLPRTFIYSVVETASPGVVQCSSPGEKPFQTFTSSGKRPQRAGLV